jgi:acetyltransferase-like isoleucine patch superfamily enzyme
MNEGSTRDAATYGNVSIHGSAFVGVHCVLGAPKERTIRRHVAARTPVQDLVSPVTIEAECIIGNHVVILEGSTVAARTVVEDHTRIGYDCRIGSDSRIIYGAYVCDRVSIGENARVAGFVCDSARIGAGSTVMGSLVHEYSSPHLEWWAADEEAPIIDPEAVVGYHATVVGNVRVGRRCYVAAGAIVTRDVPDGHVVRAINEQIPLREWHGSRLGGLIDHWLGR